MNFVGWTTVFALVLGLIITWIALHSEPHSDPIPIAIGNDTSVDYESMMHCQEQYWKNGTFWCLPWQDYRDANRAIMNNITPTGK